MPISRAQHEVWRIREELDGRLAKMTPEERRAYFAQTPAFVEARLGRPLRLRRVKRGEDAVADGAAKQDDGTSSGANA
jgi:hypothetical protein